MSKEPFDQTGADKSSDAASQDRPVEKASGSDTASTPSSADSQRAADAYVAKNSRSRRRNKGGSGGSTPSTPNASASAASTSDAPKATTPAATAAPAPTSSVKGTAETKPGAAKPPGSPPPASPPPGGRGGKAGTLAIVLVLILALVLGVVAWQLWQRLESQQARLDEIAQQTEASATQQSLNDLESRLESGETERNDTLESTVSELRGELESVQSNVDETINQVLDQLSQAQDTDERDWLHAEAAYLLRLANQRLQLEGDVEGASALLRTADARLVDADNPALTPVRREIASELAALDAVPRVDRTGLYLALNAQQERVAGLRLSQEIEERAVTSGIEQPPSGSFERQLAKFGAELRDLVVIRHHDEALETLVTPEQESYLRQSLRLILEQAQLALLKEEQPLYEASLDKALSLLDGYYDTEREETQSVIARLQELKQSDIEPELPDISGSQQAMADFIDNRFQARRQSGGEQ
ncbi:uroporphyrinogen-III C-methyltransferase [Vreelandella malpeensis]|uniref:Uroporphyrinogen-III C-methyltransferase n=1 Tax=Vreelandella malpeensis TaxID=1172368 RepID=A0ABS8DTK4_9GAMM|nr:uroporphyrinogen-III C-methyltransferase [Halomonas malpeensis]MCB8889378.1 uroporphyrinogen-III C-methyltransferase [Halomonas malpeensis]